MRDHTDPLAPYLAIVVEDYRKNLAQTSAAMGQAVLWLALVTTREERRKGSSRVDLAHELREAQDTLGKVSDKLRQAAFALEREAQQ